MAETVNTQFAEQLRMERLFVQADVAWSEARWPDAGQAWLEAGVLAHCLDDQPARAWALLLESQAMLACDRPLPFTESRLQQALRCAERAGICDEAFIHQRDKVQNMISQRQSRFSRWISSFTHI